MELISRKSAVDGGAGLYFTGKPCGRGHVAQRRVCSGTCLECEKLSARRHYLLHTDAYKSRAAERVKRNPEEVKKQRAEYYQKKKAVRHEAKRLYLLENKERLQAEAEQAERSRIAYHKEWRRQYRFRNRDRLREKKRVENRSPARVAYKKQWALRNPEKVSAAKRNRKARVRNAPGSHTGADINSIFKAQRGKCAYCRSSFSKVPKHVDHIIALVNGGSNYPSNLQLLCDTCNQRKNSSDPIEFVRTMGMLV